MQEPLTSPKIDLTPSIEQGDEAAALGEWQRAIAIWEISLASGRREAATRRIRWFLEEASPGTSSLTGRTHGRQGAVVILLIGVGCGLAGTACVLLGEHRTGTAQDVLATLAWVFYIATAGLAVAYAYRVGRFAEQSPPGLEPDELVRANQLAASLGSDHAHTKSPATCSRRGMRR